ncbi:MAG: tyrosine-type recombinase/integrase, partial [Bacteroidota bacterium]
FCQYLVDRGVIESNPVHGVRGNARPAEHSRAVLEATEVDALLTAMPTGSDLDKRDLAIVYLMLYAGLSEVEVARADIGDLEQTLLGWFLNVQGKGRSAKDQQVPLDPPVMEKIRIYLDARGRIRPDKPLMISHGRRSGGTRLTTRAIRARINGHFRRAGITRKDVTPHSLTHTAAVLWLSSGMSEEEVRRRMRHGTLDTTRIYSRQMR